MYKEKESFAKFFAPVLLLLRSRKFWIAVSSVIVVWANPGDIATQVQQTLTILFGLAGLIAVEDAAAKYRSK